MERSEIRAMRMEPWDYRAHLLLVEACLRLRVPFYWTGPGALLIAGNGLGRVLHLLAEQGTSVIGLEAFELTLPEMHPRLDLIYDADRSPGTDAQSISAGWPSDVWVDIVLAV